MTSSRTAGKHLAQERGAFPDFREADNGRPPLAVPVTAPLPPKQTPIRASGAPSQIDNSVQATYEKLAEPKVELITPERARHLLEEHNSNNRNISDAHVAKLARDMREGRWKLNYESIKIGAGGRLIDGQHRLWACLTAQVPFLTLIVYGVADDVYDTVGVGKAKDFADLVGPMDGEKNAKLLGATLRIAYFWEAGRLGQFNNAKLQPTISELRGTLQRHPEVRQACCFANGTVKKVMQGSLASFCYYAFGTKEKSARDVFFERLISGAELTKDMGVYWLRSRLLADAASKSKLPAVEKLALTVKAWNYHRQNTPVFLLRWPDSELFPEIR